MSVLIEANDALRPKTLSLFDVERSFAMSNNSVATVPANEGEDVAFDDEEGLWEKITNGSPLRVGARKRAPKPRRSDPVLVSEAAQETGSDIDSLYGDGLGPQPPPRRSKRRRL